MKTGNRNSLSPIVDRINELISKKPGPVVVALDGPSGAGKSTLAAVLEKELSAAVIPLDDFFAAQIPDPKWDEFTVEEKLKYVFDWGRVRAEVIEPLRQGKPVKWYSFDFASGLRADGTYGLEKEAKQRNPARLIVLEGAYSSSPEVTDLVDFSILMNVPREIRHARIAAREDPDFLTKWHQRWDEVEDYYFHVVRPKSSFDLVIETE